ncbi:MAG: GDSL-type esterase/lipase family protein [Ignavibacteriales bacterium]|nr:GDSL-type esterase/lipase family protein [Ignavibacteriales bacterium]
MARKWVGTWSTAPQLVETGNMPPSPGLTNNSLRQVVRVSIGGDTLRVRFSNEFSTSAVTMKSVQIAVSTGGSTINISTNRELKFGGSSEVTISAGAAVTSDPVAFGLKPRMDVAVTIYYGQTSATVTGHPGSRTTSYIVAGNTTTTTDFTGAVMTDHWYNINTIDVLTSSTAACVAILGNSITDGRGSTTNLQNRWPDVFSESLLKDSSTQQIGVLNQGIGGNCVLAGGLGPTGASRFYRDIVNQPGVRWAIVFEGVNDIGGVTSATAATTTANNLIAAYKQMIAKAHANNIRIYGGTIMPFKGNSYYNQYSEQCRISVNQWIRARSNFDGCIDFDLVMRSPLDTARIVSSYQNDGLHPDAAGHKTMGESVDLKLFAGADTTFQQRTDFESLWFEAERFVQAGSSFTIVSDASASNGKYTTVQAGIQSLTSPPAESVNLITIPFTVTRDSIYNVFARLNCPTYDEDSFWARMDDGEFASYNGLKTDGWAWTKLNSFPLTKGKHTLTIGYREDGACLDKLCITNDVAAPSGIGGTDPITLGINSTGTPNGYALEPNYPNPFNPSTHIRFSIAKTAQTSLRIYDVLGKEVTTLVDDSLQAGDYRVTWDGKDSNGIKVVSGTYLCRLTAGDHAISQKMILLK